MRRMRGELLVPWNVRGGLADESPNCALTPPTDGVVALEIAKPNFPRCDLAADSRTTGRLNTAAVAFASSHWFRSLCTLRCDPPWAAIPWQCRDSAAAVDPAKQGMPEHAGAQSGPARSVSTIRQATNALDDAETGFHWPMTDIINLFGFSRAEDVSKVCRTH